MKQLIKFDSISKDMSLLLNGIGCLFVILSHFGSYLGFLLFAPLGSGGVVIFLILSGYGLYCSNENKELKAWEFWYRRIQRVLIPYLCIRVVYYVVGIYSYELYLLHGYSEDIIRGKGVIAVLPAIVVIAAVAVLWNKTSKQIVEWRKVKKNG